MKKLVAYLQAALLVVAMALPIVAVLYADAEAVPPCNYTTCPYGEHKCCTEGGVTLYKGV